VFCPFVQASRQEAIGETEVPVEILSEYLPIQPSANCLAANLAFKDFAIKATGIRDPDTWRCCGWNRASGPDDISIAKKEDRLQ
jgi:hypothetical protein